MNSRHAPIQFADAGTPPAGMGSYFRSPWKKKKKPEEPGEPGEPPLSLNGKTHAAYHAYKRRHNPGWNETESPAVRGGGGGGVSPRASPFLANGGTSDIRAVGSGRDAENAPNGRDGTPRDVYRMGTDDCNGEHRDETRDDESPSGNRHDGNAMKIPAVCVFPETLLSCAVADKQLGWVFPPSTLWVHNPSATISVRFRVAALRREDVFVTPRRGVLKPNSFCKLTVRPAPISDVADDPGTIHSDLLVPAPNALVVVCVAVNRGDDNSDDCQDENDENNDSDSDSNETAAFDLDSVTTTKTSVALFLDVSAARECARAVAALTLAADNELEGMVTPTGGGETHEKRLESDLENALADNVSLKQELDFALLETERARREADAHAAAAVSASTAAGAASDRLARAESTWQEEMDGLHQEAERLAEAKAAEEMKRRKAVLDGVAAKLREARDEAVARAAEAETTQARATEHAVTLEKQLADERKIRDETEKRALHFEKRCGDLETEIRNDAATFSRRIQRSAAARSSFFEKAGMQVTTRFVASSFTAWRKLAVVTANAKREATQARATEHAVTLEKQLADERKIRDELEKKALHFEKRCGDLETEIRNDAATFSRRIQRSAAARSSFFEKAGMQVTTRFVASSFTAWRKLAVVTANAKRELEKKKLANDLRLFEDEKRLAKEKDVALQKKLDDAVATSKALAKRLDLTEQARVSDLKDHAKQQQVEIENLRVHLERRDGALGLASAAPTAAASRGAAIASRRATTSSFSPVRSQHIPRSPSEMTHRVHVDVVVDVDETGSPTVRSETVNRVRLVPRDGGTDGTRDDGMSDDATDVRASAMDVVTSANTHTRNRIQTHRHPNAKSTPGLASPTTLFAKAQQAAAAMHVTRARRFARDAFRNGAREPFLSSQSGGAARDAVTESLRHASNAARKTREPWNPPMNWSQRGSSEWEVE